MDETTQTENEQEKHTHTRSKEEGERGRRKEKKKEKKRTHRSAGRVSARSTMDSIAAAERAAVLLLRGQAVPRHLPHAPGAVVGKERVANGRRGEILVARSAGERRPATVAAWLVDE